MGKRNGLVEATQDITTGGGHQVPKATTGLHITTQTVAPFHILVKWPRIRDYCDTNPKQVKFLED